MRSETQAATTITRLLPAGLRRAKAEGKKLGRPRALDNKQEQEAMAMRQAGNSLAAVASALGVSRSAIQRIEQRQAQ